MATPSETKALEALRRYVEAAVELDKVWDQIGGGDDAMDPPFDVLTEHAPEAFVDLTEQIPDLTAWRDKVAEALGEPPGSGAVAGLSPGELAQRMGFPALRAEVGAYTLDGEPVDLARFIAENGLSEFQVHRIAHLSVGESITYGGGAAAEFTLQRVR